MARLKLCTNIFQQLLRNDSQFSPLLHTRLFSETHKNFPNLEKGEEIRIPTAYGHIAAVWWGPKDRKPILAIHGWQDNANTWIPLIPYLIPNVSILAIDLPGHGKSSWYPRGIAYHYADNVINMRRVIKYFDWKSVSLMGHSLGAIVSFIYASWYPNDVDYIIQLDNLKPITSKPNKPFDRIAVAVDKLIAIDQRRASGSEPPLYGYDEMIEKLHVGSGTSIPKDKCHILMERGIAKSASDPNKYYFTRDSKLKYTTGASVSQEDVTLMADRIVCPHLNIKFEDGLYFEPPENFFSMVKLLKSINAKFENHTVPGQHHSHLCNPHLIAPLINAFLLKYSK